MWANATLDPKATVLRQNCWQYMRCGREPGGARVADLGVCPASVDVSANRLNEGTNGGRICWAISGTFCGGKVQGTFAQKQLSCMTCEFFGKVKAEGKTTGQFLLLKPGQTYHAGGT